MEGKQFFWNLKEIRTIGVHIIKLKNCLLNPLNKRIRQIRQWWIMFWLKGKKEDIEMDKKEDKKIVKLKKRLQNYEE